MSDWQGTKHSGETWSAADVQRLRQLAKENTPTRVIAGLMGRTPEAVYSKASELGISLDPPNQAPYNRR